MLWHLAFAGIVPVPYAISVINKVQSGAVRLVVFRPLVCCSLAINVWCPSCIKCFKEPRSQGAAVCYGRASYLPDSLNEIFRVCRLALPGHPFLAIY